MTRPYSAALLLALFKHFEPDNNDPPATINPAAAALCGALLPEALNDLNDGQYTALVDRVCVMGIEPFQKTRLFALVNGGNLTLPVYEFKDYGQRGLAELAIWLAGNDL